MYCLNMENFCRLIVLLVVSCPAIMIIDGKILNWTNPEINSASGSGSVKERIREGSNGVLGIQIQATTDKPAYPFPMYSIIKHPEGFQFAIDEDHGHLTLNSGILDFETSRNVVLTVKVDDGEAVGTATCTIRLSDINDNTPYFPAKTMSVILDDKLTTDFTVAIVKAHDQDATQPNNMVTYQIADGNTDGDFSISSDQGIITVSNGKTLDHSRVQSYCLLVMAVDDGIDPGALSASVIVNVYVGQVPDCTSGSSGLSGGAIAGIVIGSFVGGILSVLLGFF